MLLKLNLMCRPLNNKFLLQTVNVQDSVHLNISMNGFWDGHFEK